MNVSRQQAPATETKFIRLTAPVAIGSFIDYWKVAWCKPDRNRVMWRVMVLRQRVEFRGCCG